MNNDIEIEGRPRPLSTGLWTLFSWLRRDDRSDSSESLSSAGSDRTVASFAFLTPAHYQPTKSPLVLPPLSPPTDSYKKRVHDRNLRRQYDRDLTLHRKYGLFKSGESTCGYDAFSLPPVRRINGESSGKWDRERRAASECYQRRLAHVPGKRRAPLPPVSTIPNAPPTSLNRRSTRKRRAPQPPVKVIENIKNPEVNTTVTQMNLHSCDERQKLRNNDVTMGCKSEKYSKKEGCTKDVKVKPERSFLKQIFDSKKRNSGIDISSVKLLPSISELDKQAAEIIQNSKLNASEQNNNVKNIFEKTDTQGSAQFEAWICVNCLRKYNSTVTSCSNCVPSQKKHSLDQASSTSKASNSYTQTDKKIACSVSTNQDAAEEKQKLKEMLKEMKDSLPKRQRHDFNNKPDIKNVYSEGRGSNSYSTETATLRVGCVAPPLTSNKSSLLEPSSSSNTQSPNTTAVKNAPNNKKNNNNLNLQNKEAIKNREEAVTPINIEKKTTKANLTKTTNIEIFEEFKHKKDLNTPLKISSLLNPVYVPKNFVSKNTQNSNALQKESQTEKQKILATTVVNVFQPIVNTAPPASDGVADLYTSQTSTKSAADALTGLPLPQTSRLSKVEPKTKSEMAKSPMKITVLSQGDNLLPALRKGNPVDIIQKDSKPGIPSTSTEEQNKLKDTITQDQHSRRRDLIHKLEQSIAKGDEVAAAEAAAKLAQLRLSCSVLSFSSQILSQPSTSTFNSGIEAEANNKVPAKINVSTEEVKKEPPRVDLSSVKERSSPQNVVITNITSSSGLVKTNMTVSPKSNVECVKNKQIQKKDDLVIKKSMSEANIDNPSPNHTMVTIAVLVEDREATRGPVYLRINRQALMRDLRREAETSLGLAINLQRWIVGRVLCVNDNTPIISLAGPDFSAPFYLCVVESEKKSDTASQTNVVDNSKDDLNKNLQMNADNVYKELVQLEQRALVPNAENFECGVCMEDYGPGSGVVLRECVHIFCKDCLSDVVRHCEEPDIPCPAMGCRGMLQEREIRALVTTQDFERWLARGLAAAESGTRNAFHCRTRDCKGWALCEPGVQRFPCPVCKHINCVPCQAIHDGVTCEQYRGKLKQAAASKSANTSETDDGTRTLLNSLIAKGEALECPECSAIITKKWGCDWVKCSACKTEICWVTRGRRWGPGGKGDTSGGCRCGIDGKRCHPSCGYCH